MSSIAGGDISRVAAFLRTDSERHVHTGKAFCEQLVGDFETLYKRVTPELAVANCPSSVSKARCASSSVSAT
jgi:hypothetical protein